jgi:phospholipid/cholesterol/gamma-HCH transport system ATP-binding protein
MIQVENIHVQFGEVVVLRDISFEVQRGETVCILGGSGGGKSTLLKTMIGVLQPTSGRVLFDGEDMTHARRKELNRIRRKFGVTFQSGALLNSMTVRENIALPLEQHSDLDAETIDTMVKIKLHQVDLLHAADRCPSEISGGMQKRAAVARALALDPKAIFYDEPSAGLDPIAVRRLDELINDLRDSMGITSVVVSHVMESVRRIADRVIMLDKGQVIHNGTVAELEASDDPRVQRFLTAESDGGERAVTETQFLQQLLG